MIPCPSCGNTFENAIPNGSPTHRRCANCKEVWDAKQGIRIQFYDHSFFVSVAGTLADELISFNCDSEELILEIRKGEPTKGFWETIEAFTIDKRCELMEM